MHNNWDADSLFFVRLLTLTPGLENLGLQTLTPVPSKPGLQLRLWAQNQTAAPTLGLIV